MKKGVCLSILFCGVLGAANIPQAEFAARRDYTSATGFVAIADVNGDGIPDVVTAYDTGIATLLGNGDGTFRDGPESVAGGDHYVNALVPIDLNGDGKLDLVAASDNGIGICFGNGDGSFQPAIYYTAKDAFSGNIVAGDFNGDNIPDVVMVDPAGLTLYAGKGGGVFEQGVFTPIEPSGASLAAAIVAADFNEDGKLDIAVSFGYDLKIGQTGFILLFGNGDGTFQKPVFHGTAEWPQWLATGDLNRTGRDGVHFSKQWPGTVFGSHTGQPARHPIRPVRDWRRQRRSHSGSGKQFRLRGAGAGEGAIRAAGELSGGLSFRLRDAGRSAG